MKHTLPFFLFLLASALTLAVGAQDVIDKIAQQSCDCFKSIDTTLNLKTQEAQLGICMIKYAGPYTKELKSKYGIDMDKVSDGAGKKLGEVVGVKMMTYCPDALLKFSGALDKGKETDANNEKEQLMAGNVTDIIAGQFATVMLKEVSGREQKLLWLGYFKNSEILSKDLNTLKNTQLTVRYVEHEFYNPQLKDYMKYKVITGISYKE